MQTSMHENHSSHFRLWYRPYRPILMQAFPKVQCSTKSQEIRLSISIARIKNWQGARSKFHWNLPIRNRTYRSNFNHQSNDWTFQLQQSKFNFSIHFRHRKSSFIEDEILVKFLYSDFHLWWLKKEAFRIYRGKKEKILLPRGSNLSQCLNW